jgi:glutaminyl-peptide cyclotransferase
MLGPQSRRRTRVLFQRAFVVACLFVLAACNNSQPAASASAVKPLAEQPGQTNLPPPEPAPPSAQTGGFDGAKAYDFTAKLVAFGPRPPASEAIHRTQDYIASQLKSFGCPVDIDAFNAQTALGSMAMKNIIAKIPGMGPGIIVLMTHYDTKRIDGFVGADDGGSSTGLMLEMAQVLCGRPKQGNAVWIVFLDGEETQATFDWLDSDAMFGSRELAARMAVSGDLKRIKAVILADMVGQRGLEIDRDTYSTKWLNDLIWRTAVRLGYGNVFIKKDAPIDGDDHIPFLHRGVPAVDIIDLNGYGYWHTTQDTLDKISPRSLAIVGHVLLESVAELQKR